ncbi:hypothetical protein FOZ63_033960, partial [Perkinsus olseni]
KTMSRLELRVSATQKMRVPLDVKLSKSTSRDSSSVMSPRRSILGVDYPCRGVPGVVSELEWEQVKHFASNWHLPDVLSPTTIRSLERHYTFSNLLTRLIEQDDAYETGLAVVLQDCLPGVLVVILNALAAIDFEFGKDKASEWLTMAKTLALKYVNSSEADLAWGIELRDLGPPVDMLLGSVESPLPCDSEQRLRVHVRAVHPDGSLFCGNHGQWGVEALIPAWFASSTCHSEDPNSADFVMYADHRSCHLHLSCQDLECTSLVVPNLPAKGRRADLVATLAEDDVPPAKRLLVLADQGLRVNFSHIAPGWSDRLPYLKQSVFATTEPYTAGEFPSVFDVPYKDIVIPGSISPSRLRELRASSRSTSDRDLLLSFHGRLPSNHHYYKDNVIRRVAEDELQGIPGVSIGGMVDDFFELKGRSRFCLVMPGTSNWSNHLYESIFSGCVPVIVGDRIVPAFEHLVDWSKVAVRWKESSFLSDPVELVEGLRTWNLSRVDTFRMNVLDVGCWFDYTRIHDTTCSPYLAIVRALRSKAVAAASSSTS